MASITILRNLHFTEIIIPFFRNVVFIHWGSTKKNLTYCYRVPILTITLSRRNNTPCKFL